MKGMNAFAIQGVIDGPTHPVRPDDVATSEHAQMPAEPRLADADSIREFQDGDFGDAGKDLQDAQPRDTGERLIMGAKLSKRRVAEQRG